MKIENIKFIKLTEKDLPELLEIYNHYVENTTVTWEIKKLSLNSFRKEMISSNPKYTTYAIVKDSIICGYCKLSPHSKRKGYTNTAQIAVYLKPSHVRKGIGNIAVNFLEVKAIKCKIHVLIASISGDNKASIKLFQKNGYKKCGHFKEAGTKFNKILDVVYYQKIL